MTHTGNKGKDWKYGEQEDKNLVKTVFRKMGGDKSKLSVKKIDYAMEVKHQDFEDTVVITRKEFDEKNGQAIEKLLSCFLK